MKSAKHRKDNEMEKTKMAETETKKVSENEKENIAEKRRSELTKMLIGEMQSLRDSVEKIKKDNEMLAQLFQAPQNSNSSNEQLKKLMQEKEAYKKLAVERIKDMIFSKVKESFPDVTYSSLEDFPEEFHRLVCAKVSPEIAYKVTLDSKNEKSVPASIGKINANSEQERDFYTSSEVDKLTKKQLSNPKIMNTVLKSMLKW